MSESFFFFPLFKPCTPLKKLFMVFFFSFLFFLWANCWQGASLDSACLLSVFSRVSPWLNLNTDAIFIYDITGCFTVWSVTKPQIWFWRWKMWFDYTLFCFLEALFLSQMEVFEELFFTCASSQGHALVRGLADQRWVGPHRPTVLLLMVTASLPVPPTFFIFLPYTNVMDASD